MNKLNEIILSIEKQENEEKIIIDINQKKILNKEEELIDWLFHLKEKLSKRLYKKEIKDIISANLIQKFKELKLGYKIIILYIKEKLKIIEKKIFKYNLAQNENIKYKQQIAKCMSYASKIPNELNLLLKKIPDNNIINDINYYNDIEKRNYKIELFDDIIRIHFDYIYTMSLLYYKIGNFIDSISFLSLFLTLFKEAKSLILSSHTLYKIEKCFILLSKIYILNEDYENAFILLNNSIKVCFKQIIFQVHDLFSGIFIGEKKDLLIRKRKDLLILKDLRIKKIILNIIISLFYKGICYEHLSNIKSAKAYYKQCEWFAKIFLEKNNKFIYKFFYRIKKNLIDASNNIDFLNKKIKEYEERQWLKKMEENLNEKKKNYLIKKAKLYDVNKFNGLIKKLQGLKIKEIDTVNKFEKNKKYRSVSAKERKGKDKNIYMSNIRLLEAYLRNDFKDIVNDMTKINLFDLDYKTRERVQKKLNKFYFEQNQKLIRNKNKSLINFPYQKSFTNKNNNIQENNFDNISKIFSKKKFLNNDDYKTIESNSNFQTGKRKNYKNNNINFSKANLCKNESYHLKLISKNKVNNYKTKNKIIKNLCLSNREKFYSPRNNRLQSFFSSSYILSNSQKKNNSIKFESKSMEIIKGNEKINKNQSLSKINKSKFKLIHPENHKLNEYFNSNYLKKRDYIKKLCDRELLFQKSILKFKNTPRFSFQFFNKALSQQKADESFKIIKSIVSNRIGNNDLKDNLSDEEFKEYLINNKLEETFINSLDNKALLNYKKNQKKKEIKDDENDFIEDINKYDKNFISVETNNKNTLLELNKKLEKIYKKEKKRKNEIIEHKKEINKKLYKKFHRNKSTLNSSNKYFNKHLFSYQSNSKISLNKIFFLN